MVVWICGKFFGRLNDESPASAWSVAGAFSTAAKAEAACRDETYFVGPLAIDEQLPDDEVMWPGAYYPLAN